MAAVRHVGFSKFDIFISEPSYACDFASSFQISFKSDYMEPSYSQKMIVNMASVRHLEFGNF